jgi:protein-S-isoprenylcysteine O-methyltransferase Ste14
MTMLNQKSLISRLVRRGLLAVLLTAAMLFIPAGSLKFWQGWVFLVLVLAVTLFFGIYLCKHDPQLLERRLQMREKVPEQKRIMKLGGLVSFPAFLLPGLDYRFGWSRAFPGPVPLWLTLFSLAVFPGCYLWFFWVVKVNRYASRTIQVEAGQTVIATGPYRIIRHPMYLGTVVMWLFAPVALGSFVAWPAFALLVPVIVLRLLNEEKILRQELPGYAEYCLRTRYRLIPFVW